MALNATDINIALTVMISNCERNATTFSVNANRVHLDYCTGNKLQCDWNWFRNCKNINQPPY